MISMEFFNYCRKANQMEAEYESKILNSPSFWRIYQLLLDTFFSPLPFVSGEIDIEVLKQNVIRKSSKIVEDVDLSIDYLEEEKLKLLMKGNFFHYHQDIINSAHKGTIFDIPLVLEETRSSQALYYHNKLADFKSKIFSKITISLLNDLDIMEPRYFHELGHALIERNPYVYYNHLLKEYIPICMELFYAYSDTETPFSYRKNHLNRILKHQKNQDKFIDRREKKYVICYLLSIFTLEMYDNFRGKQREGMRADFVSVLNGFKCIEEFLTDYEIDFENPKAEKMLRKTIERVQS